MMTLTFQGESFVATAKAILQSGFLPGEPARVRINNRKMRAGDDWVGRCDDSEISARWENVHDFLLVDQRRETLYLGCKALVALPTILGLLEEVPFETAVVSSIYSEWSYGTPQKSEEIYVESVSLDVGTRHHPYGLGVAFKGKGHDRVVSQRYLEDAGLWRLIRRGDMTFVQFHDAEADAETALDQARLGHHYLGYGYRYGGGIIFTKDHPYKTQIAGPYDASERKLWITVIDRDVSSWEMLDACAFRYERRNDPEQPIDNVAFVFRDEASARKPDHLRSLWRRGLECWTISQDGKKVRLDTEYVPQKLEDVELPWVKQVRERDGL